MPFPPFNDGNSMKTFKFPKFLDEYLPAKRYGDWRRMLMKDTLLLMIVDARRDTFEADRSIPNGLRLSLATYRLGFSIGVHAIQFDKWVDGTVFKKDRRYWDSLVTEAYRLN